MGDQESSVAVPLLGCHKKSIQESAENVLLSVSHHLQAWKPPLSQVFEEIKQLCSIAFPMFITGLLIYGKSAISMFFLGKLGKEALAGGSLAIGIANITGYSVISGLAMGMEAISSQAFGARQWHLMSQTLQRTIAILLTSFCIPITILWFYLKPVFLLARQDPTIASVAATFLAFSLPDLILQCIMNPLRIFLRTQNITSPTMFSAAFALALHGPINYVFVYHLGIGIEGIAMAVAITDFNLLATLLVYLWLSGVCKQTWQGWSLECFKEWKPILALAIPSCISVCLEWWWYELMIVLSSFLPNNANEAIATMGILIQATALIYIFPSSLSLAVSTRVGNELGANQPTKARASSIIALSCASLMSLIAMLFMVSIRHAWGQIFTTDEVILALTSAALPVVGLCELGNFPQTTGSGVLRGCARPSLGANINFGSFYGVGFPVAMVMGFWVGLGLLGLMLGLLSAQIVCAIIMILALLKTNWQMQANRARQLTGTGGEDGVESITISDESTIDPLLA